MKRINIFCILLSLVFSSCNFWPWKEHDSVQVRSKPFAGVAQITPKTAYYNPMPSSFAVSFPESVDMSSVSSEDLHLTGSGSCPSSPFVSSSNVGHLMIVLLNTAGCSNGDVITVTVNMASVRNHLNQLGQGEHVVKYTYNTDNAPAPVINLASGSFNSFPGQFKMIFNGSIDMSSVTPDMVTIAGSGSCASSPLTGFTPVGHEVTVTYTSVGCTHGDSLEFVINNSDIRDSSGRHGAGIEEYTLTLDLQGIGASSVVLSNLSGDRNPLPASVSLAFPTDVNMDSITLSDFIVTGTGACPSPILGSINKTGHTAELNFNSVGCLDGNKINFMLPMSGVLDVSGNPGTGNLSASWRLVTAVPSAPVWNTLAGVVASLPSVLSMGFNDSINMATINTNSITATSNGGCPTNPLSGVTKNGVQADLSLTSQGCANGDSITLNIDMSKIANTVGTYGSGIISKTFTLDTQGPASPILSLDSGSFANLPTTATLVFGDDTKMSTVNTSTIQVIGTGGCAGNALSNLAVSNKTVTLGLNPSSCANQDTITLKVLMAQIQDNVGNLGTGTVVKTLVLDSTVPAFPAIDIPGGVVTSLPTLLRFQFDPNVDMNSVALEDFTVQGSGACPVSPLVSYNEVGSQVELSLSSLGCSHDDTFIVTLAMSGVTNNLGSAGSGIFRNIYKLDTQGPSAPTPSVLGATVASLPLTIRFDYPADALMSSVTMADFSVGGTGGCSSASFDALSIVGTVATLTFNPSSCSSTDQLVIKALMAGVTDSLGNAGAGEVVVAFTLDNDGPVLPSITPASAVLAGLPSLININFSSDTLMSSVGLNDFTFTATGSCSGSLTNLVVNGQSTTVQLHSTGCVLNDIVTFRVSGAGITDVLGNPAVGSVQAQYTLDNQGIDASSVTISPLSATLASFPAPVVFTFPSDTDMNSVDASDFTSTVTGTCPSNAIGSISKTGQTVLVNLYTFGCLSGNAITVGLNLSGVRDALGNSGTGIAWATYTLDNVGPANAVFNVASATVRSLPSPIILNFSNDTEMNSVSSADITVSGTGACSASVLSTFSKSAQTATLSVNSAGCTHGDTLNISLAMTGVTDAVGNAGVGAVNLTYTFDLMGPASPTVNLASGARSAIPTSLVYTFSNDTDMSSVSAANFTATGLGNCTGNPLSTLSKTGQVATLNLHPGACAQGDGITVNLDMSAITDTYGNLGSGTVIRTFTLDSVGPANPTNSVASGSFMNLPTTLNLTFSSDTDMSSVSIADFAALGNGSCPANALGSLTKSGQVVTLTLVTTGCSSGHKIDLTLNMTGVTDSIGNPGVGTLNYVYTLDNTGPANAVNGLASGTFSVLPTTVSFTFTSDTEMSSVSAADFTATGTGTCQANALTGITKSGQIATVTLQTVGCVTNNTITLSLNMAGVTDVVGNAGAGVLSYVYTLDNTGPASATLNLASSTLMSLPSSVVFTFSSDTDMSSVTAADFTAIGNGTCPANALSGLSKNAQSVTLTLNTVGCSNGHKIDVNLNMSGVTDAVGNAGTGIVGASYVLDSSGPANATLSLASSVLATLPTSVSFTFSSDTDMSSVTAADFTASGTGTCPANALSGLSKSGQIATVTLTTTGCSNNHRIDLVLNMSGVTDDVGNAGSGTVAATYTLDSVGPASATISLASATFATLPSSVNFTFSSDTDMSSVSIADFTATGTGSCLANALSSVSKSGQIATVTLTNSGCTHSNRIDLSLNMMGVTDSVGNPGVGTVSGSYTLDTVGPANATSSVATATLTALPSFVNFTFSADTDMASVTSADFSAVGSGSCVSNALVSISKAAQVASVNLNTSSCLSGDKIVLTLNMASVTDAVGNPGTGNLTYTYTLDNTGPSTATSSIATATFAALPNSVDFTFSSDTDMNSVTSADFTATGSGSCSANALSGLSKSGQVATVSLSTTGCANNDKITLALNMTGVIDAIGNMGLGTTSYVYTLDNVGPTSATIGSATATYQAIPSTVLFTFSSDTDMSSVTAADFSAVGTGTCPANALTGISKSAQVATVTLNTAGCTTNSTIALTLNMAGISDAVGNTGFGLVAGTYTLDNTGPSSASGNVATGTYMSMPTSVNFTFSSDTSMASVTVADFSGVTSGSCPGTAINSFSKSGQMATVTLNTTGCVTNNTISLSLDMSGVTDSVGNAGSGTVSYVYTLDNTPPANPTVSTVGGNVLLLPSSVTYTFASDVNMSTVTAAAFSGVGSGLCLGNPLTGVAITGNTAVVSINTVGCILNSTIRIDLNMTGVKDLVGNPGVGVFSNTYKKVNSL